MITQEWAWWLSADENDSCTSQNILFCITFFFLMWIGLLEQSMECLVEHSILKIFDSPSP